MHAYTADALILQQRLLLVYKANTCSDTLVIGYIRNIYGNLRSAESSPVNIKFHTVFAIHIYSYPITE